MMFVFGKRAKQLRLNKVSELIHKSTNFRNLEYARVEVHFHEIIDSDVDPEGCKVTTFVLSHFPCFFASIQQPTKETLQQCACLREQGRWDIQI